MDVDIKSVQNVDPIPIQPLTIADVQKIAPAAVHIKELNQIAPLLVESLRVDHIRHVDPLRVDQLNVTHLPTVNLTLSRLPQLDVSVRRVPPLALSLQQRFDLPARYRIRTRLLGFEIMRFEIDGEMKLVPRNCARSEQSHSTERSFPDVAAAGNPAIPTRTTQRCTQTITRVAPPTGACDAEHCADAPWPAQSAQARHPARLSAGAPRFHYALGRGSAAAPAAQRNVRADSSVASGD
ncbi:hypothetical protein OKW43_008076 [Paraburkholderia sp. WC7.3g]|uniref:hypothetical protein n=1 Tax=Paraburkholderia sp. WC7.3g TaxID=2991070 RepID=UPI003D217F92